MSGEVRDAPFYREITFPGSPRRARVPGPSEDRGSQR